MLRLLASDTTNPLYHLVFMRRVKRASSVLLEDLINSGEVIEEGIEDVSCEYLDFWSIPCISLVLFCILLVPHSAAAVQHLQVVLGKVHRCMTR